MLIGYGSQAKYNVNDDDLKSAMCFCGFVNKQNNPNSAAKETSYLEQPQETTWWSSFFETTKQTT